MIPLLACALIRESKMTDAVCAQFANSLAGTSVSKDDVMKMLGNVYDSKSLLNLSKHFASTDADNYFPYQPSDDDFLVKDKAEKIKGQMADYIVKFICNKE